MVTKLTIPMSDDDITALRVGDEVALTGMMTGGWSGLAAGLTSAGLGFLCLLIPYVLGGMGAGDVKLAAALGACRVAIFKYRVAGPRPPRPCPRESLMTISGMKAAIVGIGVAAVLGFYAIVAYLGKHRLQKEIGE